MSNQFAVFAVLLKLQWISTVLSESCSETKATFHQTTGVDCVSSEFTRIASGQCTPLECSNVCAKKEKCQAFTMLTAGTCQCKLFLFDACSHRVQSAPNCTHEVTVYVKSLTGVPPGRLCPPGYQHTRYGTSYKMVTSPTLKWTDANQTCNSEPGLSKFTDAIDREEALYLRFLKQVIGNAYSYYIGGSGNPANSLSSWSWAACNLPVNETVWHKWNQPNGGLLSYCANIYGPWVNGGIDDFDCNVNQRYICECQSVF